MNTNPLRHDPLTVSAPFWEGVGLGLVRLQQCGDCDRFHHYPRPFCPFCASRNLTWRDTSGQGTIHSFAHQPSPDDVGIMIVLVDLAEGPRVLSRFVGDHDVVRVGAPVRAVWGTDGERPLLLFGFDSADS